MSFFFFSFNAEQTVKIVDGEKTGAFSHLMVYWCLFTLVKYKRSLRRSVGKAVKLAKI